jgi:hypothetical protein
MEIRNSCKLRKHNGRPGRFSNFEYRVSLFAFLLTAGCGAPGEPVPPAPAIPVAIVDLSAHQAGDGVQLTFSLPGKSVTGERLAEPPAVEILRGSPRPDGTPDAKSLRVVDTIPGALAENYVVRGRVQFLDPIAPEETRAHPGQTVIYRVRTRVSQKRTSADSNAVTLRVFPVPERIASLEVRVSEPALELSWPAPTHTSGGEPLTATPGYRIYRGELDPATAEAAAKDLSQANWKSPLLQIAASYTNSYRDTGFDFGKTYLFIVRSSISVEGTPLESADSVPAVVSPRDTFPPAAPQGLVAAVLPGSAAGTLLVDLSWSINVETDFAGYRVYRSDQEGTRGQLLPPDLLPAPAYRDSSVVNGRRYWYTVTAVDRAGNESAPSAPIVVDVTQPTS